MTPGASAPWSVTTVAKGFTTMTGALYDGQNVWVTDRQAGKLQKLDSNGAIVQSVVVGQFPQDPVFDGANIWVPNFLDNTVSVVQASTGTVLTTLTDVRNQSVLRRVRRSEGARRELRVRGLPLESGGLRAVGILRGQPPERRLQRRSRLLGHPRPG